MFFAPPHEFPTTKTAITADDQRGYLAFGPYTTWFSAGEHTATFRLLVDNHTADNQGVVTLDVWDGTSRKVLAQREVQRQEFAASFTYQDFELVFAVAADGHRLEFRTPWQGTSYVRQDRVTVSETSLEILREACGDLRDLDNVFSNVDELFD